MLEEKFYYYQVNSRVAKIPGRLIPSNEVIKGDQSHNPFANISNEVLFN